MAVPPWSLRLNSYAAGPVLACVFATISDSPTVLHVKPTRNWKQSILADEGGDGLEQRLRTGVAAADVKKNWATWRRFATIDVGVSANRRGRQCIFLRASACQSNGTSLSFGRSVWPLAAHDAVTAVWLHRMAVLDMPHAGTCL
jgi:hypothetical protein